MLVSVASSTTAAACSTPRTGSPVAVAAATNRSAVLGFGDVAALHHDVGAGRADALDGLLRFGVGLGAGGEHDPAAARRGHLLGEEQPEATQATGDDVGAVAAEDPSLLGRHHHAAVPGVRDVEHEFAGVLGRAHHPNRGGRLGKRVVGAAPGVATHRLR